MEMGYGEVGRAKGEEKTPITQSRFQYSLWLQRDYDNL